jgi:hypothetical protein
MNARTLAVVVGLAALLFAAFRAFGWWGFSLVSSGIVFWLLQLTTRLMRTMENAADQPLGTVSNAVMFHAQLHKDLRLLNVIGLASSLGQRVDTDDKTTEVFNWCDPSGDCVQCHFREGRLQQWRLSRTHSESLPQDAT